MSVAVSGSDTVKINDRLLIELGDGDVSALTYPNDLVSVKTGKNGNVMVALNQSGKQAELVLRVLRGGSDDKFLNNLFVQMGANLAGFTLLTGEFVKKVGYGNSRGAKDTYMLASGVISKGVEATDNAEGNTDQVLSVYHLRFGKAIRVIQ